ncbi:MAG TPA: glycosyltransferase [Xanthobacteraceae bacterium]|jgi:glycosyltransferase involved in cell wall biosynthesis
MLSVVIATHDSERALLPTLAALVQGAVAGVVREVIIADAGSQDATTAIADGAGCRVVSLRAARGVRLKAAAAAARAPWLLFLAPGTVPDPAWIDETRRFIEFAELTGRGENRAAMFRPGPTGLRPALTEALALLWGSLAWRRQAQRGLLIGTALYDAIGGHRDVGQPERDLARRVGRGRLVLLQCRATAGLRLDT